MCCRAEGCSSGCCSMRGFVEVDRKRRPHLSAAARAESEAAAVLPPGVVLRDNLLYDDDSQLVKRPATVLEAAAVVGINKAAEDSITLLCEEVSQLFTQYNAAFKCTKSNTNSSGSSGSQSQTQSSYIKHDGFLIAKYFVLGSGDMAMAVRLPPHLKKNGFRNPVTASMRDARELVQSGAVISVTPKQVAALISKTSGYKLLDVRPIWERQNSYVSGSFHVPLFVEDTDMSPATLLKKWIHFGYIGMWMGHKFTTDNQQFVEQVLAVASQDTETKLLLACGEGLRSLLAVEKLHRHGFSNLAWLSGGFATATRSDFSEVEGATELKFANIGGAAQYFLQIILFFQGFGSSS